MGFLDPPAIGLFPTLFYLWRIFSCGFFFLVQVNVCGEDSTFSPLSSLQYNHLSRVVRWGEFFIKEVLFDVWQQWDEYTLTSVLWWIVKIFFSLLIRFWSLNWILRLFLVKNTYSSYCRKWKIFVGHRSTEISGLQIGWVFFSQNCFFYWNFWLWW